MSDAKNDTPAERRIKRIVVDRDLCIGSASCVALAGKVFQLDEHQKAVVVDPRGASDDDILAAAQSCPVFAIALDDAHGKRVYPPEARLAEGGPPEDAA